MFGIGTTTTLKSLFVEGRDGIWEGGWRRASGTVEKIVVVVVIVVVIPGEDERSRSFRQ